MSIFFIFVGVAMIFASFKLWIGAGKAGGEGAANLGAKLGMRWLAILLTLFGFLIVAGGVIAKLA